MIGGIETAFVVADEVEVTKDEGTGMVVVVSEVVDKVVVVFELLDVVGGVGVDIDNAERAVRRGEMHAVDAGTLYNVVVVSGVEREVC